MSSLVHFEMLFLVVFKLLLEGGVVRHGQFAQTNVVVFQNVAFFVLDQIIRKSMMNFA